MDLVWETSSYRGESPSSSFSSIAEATAGNDVSSFLNSREEAPSVEVHSKHWVRVLHLEATTTDAQLKKMFYPYGADEAFTVMENGLLAGYVGFGMVEMAKLGVDKMHDFIPCRQTQALEVRTASLEDVLVARTSGCTRSCSAAPVRPSRSLVSVLYSSATEREVSAFIQGCTDVSATVAEVAREISRASRTILERIMLSLTELPLTWRSLQDFREGLLRQLLRLLLDATDRCPAQGANCGTAIGNLFAMRVVDGDPFQIASRLLQRGADSVVHVDSICLIARVCNELPQSVSKASFWELAGNVAAQTANPEIRAALMRNLRPLSMAPQCSSLPTPAPYFSTRTRDLAAPLASSSPCHYPKPFASSPHVTMPAVPAANALPFFAASRELPSGSVAKSRTVYVSHLPPMVMQSTLMNYLLLAGPVNKVRICAGNGHATLFAFVEMQSEVGAHATMRLNGVELMGAALRVQLARNAIQDDVPEDAAFNLFGERIKPCQFGDNCVALKDCIVRMPGSR